MSATLHVTINPLSGKESGGPRASAIVMDAVDSKEIGMQIHTLSSPTKTWTRAATHSATQPNKFV